MLVLSSVSFGATSQDTTLDSYIQTQVSGNNISVALLVFEAGQPKAGLNELKAQYDNMTKACSVASDFNACMKNASITLSKEMNYPVNFSTAKGANFTFQYWNAFAFGGSGWSTLSGCSKVSANTLSQVYTTNGTLIDYYTATCSVDPKIYEGRKVSVRILYLPGVGEDITATEARVELSSASATSLNFTSYFSDALSGVTGTGANTGSQLPCLGVFVILGLLLASMYFSGKSPISLLDITTPRLPSPKGFTAGGQVITPFGYTEMKRVTRKSMGAAGGVAGSKLPSLLKQTSSSQQSAVNQEASRGGLSGDEEKVKKAIALSLLSKGEKMSEVRKILKSFDKMDESDHAHYRRMLSKLERTGRGDDALFAKVAADMHLAQNLMQTLDKVTYKGGKIETRLQKTVGKLYGVDRYAIIGPMITGSLDSMLRSKDQLKNLGKAMAVHGGQLVRETGRLAVETAGGKAAVQDLKASSPWLYDQLTKKPKAITFGKMVPVDQKMAHLYTTLYDEMHRDQIRYLLKQLYNHEGVKTTKLTDEILSMMAHKEFDLAKLVGYDAAKHAGLDAKIAAILSSHTLSITEKRDKLELLLKTLGGHIDGGYYKARDRLEAINSDAAAGHVKLVMLQEMVERENIAQKAAKEGEARSDDKYYSLVGRNSLHGSDLLEVALFRRMISDHENGQAAKEVTLRDFMNSLRLDVENRYRSLDPTNNLNLLPDFMRDKGVAAAKVEANRKALASLLTDEGERAMAMIRPGKNRNNATLEDFMSVLYGSEYMHKSQGIKMDESSGVHIDQKTGKTLWWEEDRMIGPQAGWWKTDMKRLWHNGLATAYLGEVGAWVEAKSERSYHSMLQTRPDIQADLDRRYAGAKTWTPEQRMMETKKAWVKENMEKDLHNTFNDRFAMNAYGGTTNTTMKYQMSMAASFLLKSLRDAGFEENHGDVRFLKSMDVTRAEDLKRLSFMLSDEAHGKKFAETLKKGVTLDDIAKSKHAWLQTWEGTYAPLPGEKSKLSIPVSDNDRILGGHIGIRDEKGVMRRFDPDSTPVQFKGRDDLANSYGKLRSTTNKEEWQPFLKNVVAWTKENGNSYEREKVLATVLWNYGNTTHDYQSYWRDSAVKLVPRHEAMPLEPTMLRQFGIEAPALSKTLKPIRDFGQLMGQYLLRTAYDGMGEYYTRQYDVCPKSNILKMHQWRLSSEILTTNWNDMLKDVGSEYDRQQIGSSYRAMALSQGAYHQVWAYSIDRSFKASSSHGAHGAWSNAFNYGPACPFPLRANLRAYMDQGEYTNFMAIYGWPALAGRKMIRPYQNIVASFQRSMQGYASRWDSTNDPLRPAGNYTSPRLLEAFRNLNPMSFSWGRNWASQKMSGMNKYESRAEKAQLSGYDFQMGLRQAYSDIQVTYKGAANIARFSANPGLSYNDTKFNEQLSPAMAEYAMMKMGPMSGYFKEDPYVRKMAMTDMLNRTVSAEALAIRRQQELAGFGISQNSLYTWFSPVTFPWHMGIPGFPSALSGKEIIYGAVNRFRPGYHGGNIGETVSNGMKKVGMGMQRAFSPSMAAMQKFCAKCGSSSFSPGVCKGCGARI